MTDFRSSANARAYSSKFSVDTSISASTRSTKAFVLLVLTLLFVLLVLCASSLPRACADTCAVDAHITVMVMLM